MQIKWTDRFGLMRRNMRRWILKTARRLMLKERYRIGRTIAILLDESSLQMAAARRFWHLSRLINVTKVYVPQMYDTKEKRRNFLIDRINEYVKEFGSSLTRYVLGINGSESVFRIITLPNMPRKELIKAIYWEGDKRIPFGLDNAYYGQRFDENVKTPAGDTVSASLVAVLKEVIDSRLDLLRSARIVDVDSINHELEAIGCILPFIDDFDPDQTYVLVNIKRKTTEINFYQGRQLQFTHTGSVGSETLSIGPGNAENQESSTENLTSEIQNSLDYYVGQFPGSSTEMIFLYGDLCYSDELIDALSEHTGIQFKRLPLTRGTDGHALPHDNADQIPVSLGAVALAMAEYDLISFLPPKIKEKRTLRRYIRMAVPAIVVLIVTLLTFWASVIYQIGIEKWKLVNANIQIEQIKGSASYGMYTRLKRQMVADQAIVEKLNRKPTFLHLNLKELSRITPGKIKLDLYDLYEEDNRNYLVLTGCAFSQDPPPEVVLAEYIAQLDSSPFFKDVSLRKHSKHDRSGEFVIDFRIEMEAII
jgi:Tfp pilus assembly PilM family ATPase